MYAFVCFIRNMYGKALFDISVKLLRFGTLYIGGNEAYIGGKEDIQVSKDRTFT